MTLVQGLGQMERGHEIWEHDRDAQIWCITLELYVMDGLHHQAACDVALICGVLLQVPTAGKTKEISARRESLTERPEQI